MAASTHASRRRPQALFEAAGSDYDWGGPIERGQMLPPKDLALCAACALVMPIGQVMFKMAANRHNAMTGGVVSRIAHNPMLFGAFALYGASSLLWFYILTRIPLSQAYPIIILGGALVPLFAWVMFREPLSWGLMLGYVLMLAGLALVQRSIA
jgi:drug/metabolite transporter (DMT)-like permease